MYYYSKNSRKKVVHSSDCFYIQNSEIDNIDSFETLEEVYQNGYRLCRHCSPIAKQYRKESNALAEFCRKHAALFFFRDKYIGINTPYSRWRIVPAEGRQGFALYHKNTFETKHDNESTVPGYHLQKVRKNSVQSYLEYIVRHEDYRMTHPVFVRPEKKEPPRKGTKQYKKQQKKAERRARKQSIINVLNLIDSLSVQTQPAVAIA